MNLGNDNYESSSTSINSFTCKWLTRLIRELCDRHGASTENAAGQVKPSKPCSMSLAFAKILNLFDRPFFYLGIAFIAWLVLEAVLQWILPISQFRLISSRAQQCTKFIGPTVIGYWTNWLAIKMLFHPRRPNGLWQGLIPARRNELVRSLAVEIHDRLFSAEIVSEYLQTTPLMEELVGATERVTGDVEFRQELKSLVRTYLERLADREETRQVVRQMVGEIIENWRAKSFLEMPAELTKEIWGPWIQSRIIEALPTLPDAMGSVFDRYDQWFDRLSLTITHNRESIEKAVSSIVEQGLELLDIQQILHNQLAKMDERQLEEALTGNIMEELVFIQTSGGFFGLMVALALEYPLVRLPLLAIGVGLGLIYRKTVR